jgi:hypothetical protein
MLGNDHLIWKKFIVSFQNIFWVKFKLNDWSLGIALTTVLPVLFKYCYKYCYSDSRKLWAAMKAGGLVL